MTFHEVVKSSTTPAPTPAFPAVATHAGYLWLASQIRSKMASASASGRPRWMSLHSVIRARTRL